MYPDEQAKKSLQDEFDELNRMHGFHSYDLSPRALAAAHRISLTDGAQYKDMISEYETLFELVSKLRNSNVIFVDICQFDL